MKRIYLIKMAKISLALANEMMEKEKEILKEISFQEKKFKNPYWGLKCNRGLWLTRFLKGSLPKDPEFTMAYVEAGGGLDSMGHYGVNPQHLRDLESQGWSYEEIVLLAQGVPEHLCRYEGVSPQNFRTLDRGLKRADALQKMQVEYACSVWTLGSMPIEKFLRRLFKNGIRVTSCQYGVIKINHLMVYRPYYAGHRTIYGNINTAPEAISEGGSGRRLYDVERFLPASLLNYCRKCSTPKVRAEMESPSAFIFSSVSAAKFFAEKARKEWSNNFVLGKRRIHFSQTSNGLMAQIHPKLILMISIKDGYHDDQGRWIEPLELTRTVHSVRQVAGFNTSKVGRTWFVWQGDFSNHIEGYGDLRSVIEMAEKRRKRNSLILTLNDVRNDKLGTAGFCLQGTKWFLENKMPHLYRLVAQYRSWAEIPEDIMSIEWHLATRNIFDGYSSPVQ
jgi:hypothetical protein